MGEWFDLLAGTGCCSETFDEDDCCVAEPELRLLRALRWSGASGSSASQGATLNRFDGGVTTVWGEISRSRSSL